MRAGLCFGVASGAALGALSLGCATGGGGSGSVPEASTFTCPTNQTLCTIGGPGDGGTSDAGPDAGAGARAAASADAGADATTGDAETIVQYCASLDSDPLNCGGCGITCATQCSGHVAATACKSGMCTISACDTGYSNNDGECSSGCECHAGTNTSCGGSDLGTFPVGTFMSTVNGALPVAGESAWYMATFTGNDNLAFHPLVTLVTSDKGVTFNVYTSCMSGGTKPPACGTERVDAVGVSTWETRYTAGDPTEPLFQPIAVSTVYIEVVAPKTAPKTCNSFTLAVSNG